MVLGGILHWIFHEHSKGFLFREIALHCDYSLVVIHPDTAKLSVQSRQFLIIVKQGTIHFYHTESLIKIPSL